MSSLVKVHYTLTIIPAPFMVGTRMKMKLPVNEMKLNKYSCGQHTEGDFVPVCLQELLLSCWSRDQGRTAAFIHSLFSFVYRYSQTFHPQMKIQSSSTHTQVDAELGEASGTSQQSGVVAFS